MRKAWLFLLFLLVALGILAGVAWTMRTSLVAQLLSRHLNRVPVTLQALERSPTGAILDHLWIGTPPKSKTRTSFSSDTIAVDSTFNELRSTPLTIDRIQLDTIFIGIEFYNPQGTKSNWSTILRTSNKKSQRPWLIRTLILNNLTVEVTQSNGQTKQYPTIPRMEFHNISSETGLPLEEIEKAIFQLIMQELFQRLNLNQLFQNLQNIPGSPLKYFPNPF